MQGKHHGARTGRKAGTRAKHKTYKKTVLNIRKRVADLDQIQDFVAKEKELIEEGKAVERQVDEDLPGSVAGVVLPGVHHAHDTWMLRVLQRRCVLLCNVRSPLYFRGNSVTACEDEGPQAAAEARRSGTVPASRRRRSCGDGRPAEVVP